MLHEVLSDRGFHQLLQRIDEDLAERTRIEGCRECAARLHRSYYRRKPRGVAVAELSPQYPWRASFCCQRDGCRLRHLAPSVRFLGRRVYLGAVVVVVSALRCGVSPRRLSQLRQLFGVDRHTVQRWRRWWQDTLPQTPLWRSTAAVLMPPLPWHELPQSVLDRFRGTAAQRLLSVLRHLAGLSVSGAAVQAG